MKLQIFSQQSCNIHSTAQQQALWTMMMSCYRKTYIHTQGLFEFLRNSFYLFLLRVKLLQCKILLPLNKKKTQGLCDSCLRRIQSKWVFEFGKNYDASSTRPRIKTMWFISHTGDDTILYQYSLLIKALLFQLS